MGAEIDYLTSMLKLVILLYADDTVILAESAEELQTCLNSLANYCKENKFTVNLSKTKVIVFSRNNRLRFTQQFSYDGQSLNIADQYTYLGIVFQKNGNFFKAKAQLRDQAQRAMFGLIKKCQTLNLPIRMQLHLFDSTVVPILLYGAEVWGFEDVKCLETID